MGALQVLPCCGRSEREPPPGTAGAANAGTAPAAAAAGADEARQPNASGHDDLIVRSSVMEAYEGLTVFATFDHNTGDPSRSDPRWDAISNGSFELEWVKGFDRDTYGAYVVLFVDTNDDTLCSPDSEPAWATFADNDFMPNQPVILDFDPDPASGSFVQSITCDQFDTWFGEDYRPPAP